MSREAEFHEAFEKYHSDKGAHGYASVYASLPKDISSIFEVGIYWGGSLLTWAEMFPGADVVGFDINVALLNDPQSKWKDRPTVSRISVIQDDLRFCDFSLLQDFDLIIDDGTHEPDHIKRLWDCLHKKAKRYYIIEDLYLSRMMDIWHHVVKDVPKAQVMFWRTSDHCGDDRILPDSDSNVMVVKF